MKLIFSTSAWKNYLYWQQTDTAMLKRINQLIQEIQIQPYQGMGKPAALKQSLSGCWSRRINHEHRIIYKISNNTVLIAQLYYRY